MGSANEHERSKLKIKSRFKGQHVHIHRNLHITIYNEMYYVTHVHVSKCSDTVPIPCP